MATRRGVPCPTCDGAELTEYVALLPAAINGVPTLAHKHAIGPACYAKQWAEVYPEEPCPITVPKAKAKAE